MDRREFLSTAAALGTTGIAAAAGILPKRPYKNGIELSIIALGGIAFPGLLREEDTLPERPQRLA